MFPECFAGVVFSLLCFVWAVFFGGETNVAVQEVVGKSNRKSRDIWFAVIVCCYVELFARIRDYYVLVPILCFVKVWFVFRK